MVCKFYDQIEIPMEMDKNTKNFMCKKCGLYASREQISDIKFKLNQKARNNVLNNNYQSGIDCYYIYNAIEVLNNVISMSVNAHSNSSGIALTFCFNTSGLSQRVESNKIINAKTYGIILNSPGGNNGSPTKVYNNMICGGFGNYGSNYGIYVNNGGYYTEIYHNSVLMDYPAAIVHALSYSGGTVQIKNNIFVCNTYSGNAYPIYSTSTISGNCINYNIYYNATKPQNPKTPTFQIFNEYNYNKQKYLRKPR